MSPGLSRSKRLTASSFGYTSTKKLIIRFFDLLYLCWCDGEGTEGRHDGRGGAWPRGHGGCGGEWGVVEEVEMVDIIR